MPKLPTPAEAASSIARAARKNDALKPFHGKRNGFLCFRSDDIALFMDRARSLGVSDGAIEKAIVLHNVHGQSNWGMIPRAAIERLHYKLRDGILSALVQHPADDRFLAIPEMLPYVEALAARYGFTLDGKPLTHEIKQPSNTELDTAIESIGVLAQSYEDGKGEQNQRSKGGISKIEELEQEPTTPSLRSGVVAAPTDLFGDPDAQKRFQAAVIKLKPERKKPERHQLFESWEPDFDLIAYAQSIGLDPIAAKRGLSRFRDNHIGRRARLASSWNDELKLWLQQDAKRITGGKPSLRVRPKLTSGQSDKREQERQFIEYLPAHEQDDALAAWKAKWCAYEKAENLTADRRSDVSATSTYQDRVSPASGALDGFGEHAEEP